jgi:hypothetical protein
MDKRLLGLEVGDDGSIGGKQYMITADGGLAVKFIAAGSDLVAGEMVTISGSGNRIVLKTPAGADDCIGVVYADAAEDYDVWVTVYGPARVLLDDAHQGQAANYLILDAANAGRANFEAPNSLGRVFGYGLETTLAPGTDVKCLAFIGQSYDA